MTALSDFLEADIIRGLFRTNSITTRANSTAYSAGDRVTLATYDGNIYEVITAGTSAASPPAFNTNLGDTTTDGGVTWLTLRPGPPKRPLFFALYTAAPSDSGGGTEVSGGSYARVAYNPLDANWTLPTTTGLTENSNAITFPAPTANWGSVTHFGVFDRLTGGNLLHHGPLVQAKTVNNGDPAPSYPANSFDLTWA